MDGVRSRDGARARASRDGIGRGAKASVSASVEPQAALLCRILDHEARSGFDNSAVTGGGIDRLELWDKLPRRAQSIRQLPPMNGRRYSSLDSSERSRWALAAKRLLLSDPNAGFAVSSAKGKNAAPAKPSSKRQVRRPATPSPRPEETSLETAIESLKFVHRTYPETLRSAGLQTVRDVLWYFPIRHIDYSHQTKIVNLEIGEEATVVGEIVNISRRLFGGRRGTTQARISDGTGYMNVIWFNMPYLATRWNQGDRVVLSGAVGEYGGRATMQNPEYDDLTRGGKESSQQLLHAGTVVPVYSLKEGVNQRSIRAGIWQVIEKTIHLVEDHLPASVIRDNGLLPLAQAIKQMHYPRDVDEYQRAFRRLAFDELLFNQIAALRRKKAWKLSGLGVKITPDRDAVEDFIDSLDFRLTSDQRDSLETILEEIGSGAPMARLLQGEVGSGKTVVAIAAMLAVSGVNAKQAALMAPTEVLAEQHFMNIIRQLDCDETFDTTAPVYESNIVSVRLDNDSKRGVSWSASGTRRADLWSEASDGWGEARKLRVALLTGSLRQRDKSDIQAMCASGEVDIVVGTHALLQENVSFADLALAVVDEQQRFGTEQRAALTKSTPRPHLLAMSATPIPRTLHMTFYGEMDLSTLKALPHGRREIPTRWASTQFEESEAYAEMRNEVADGRQGFVVCPLIDPSEKVPGAAAIDEYDRLSKGYLRGVRVGLLHGRMSLAEKQSVMEKFREKSLDVLVATPVIEVGVDVPNATVMIILTAEQFGLSQLHQIRGRVGRGKYPGKCILVSEAENERSVERIQALVDNNDGFALAEKDLEMRGPGKNLDTTQSGWSGWRFARFTDLKSIERARDSAQSLLESDPNLSRSEHLALRKEVIKAVGAAPAEYA